MPAKPKTTTTEPQKGEYLIVGHNDDGMIVSLVDDIPDTATIRAADMVWRTSDWTALRQPRSAITNILQTTDAAVWAEWFMQVAADGGDLDEGAMLGWFANAIETTKMLVEEQAIQNRPEPPAANVIEAINRVKRDLPGIGKSKDKDSDVPYAFRGIEALTAHLQGLTAKHGVVIMPMETLEREDYEYQTNSGTTWHETRIRFRWAVYGPGGPGDSIFGETWGFGRDNQDKGASKAQTQAFKEFMIKLFCIGDKSTDGDSDIAEEQIPGELRRAADTDGTVVGAGAAPPRNWVTLGWMDEPAKGMAQSAINDAAADAQMRHDSEMKLVKDVLGLLPADTRTALVARRQAEMPKLPWSHDEIVMWSTWVNEAYEAAKDPDVQPDPELPLADDEPDGND